MIVNVQTLIFLLSYDFNILFQHIIYIRHFKEITFLIHRLSTTAHNNK